MDELKKKYPLCTSVAYYASKVFRSHSFKVTDDREFIRSIFKKLDIDTLIFMEYFYQKLLLDRTCEKDVFSKNAMSMVTLDENTQVISFTELKRQRKYK